MKKLSALFLSLFILILAGASCTGGGNANANANQNTNEQVVNANANVPQKTCDLLGAWKFTLLSGPYTLVVDSIFNDDGSVPEGSVVTCVGSVDSTYASISKDGETVTGGTELSPDFGLYELNGDQIILRKAYGNETVATGTLTSPVTASGTWTNPKDGSAGSWTAEKISN